MGDDAEDRVQHTVKVPGDILREKPENQIPLFLKQSVLSIESADCRPEGARRTTRCEALPVIRLAHSEAAAGLEPSVLASFTTNAATLFPETISPLTAALGRARGRTRPSTPGVRSFCVVS